MLRWGLIPRWAKDLQKSPKPINAQAEPLFTKPMFARLTESHRCLVPADGFYEWAKPKRAGGRKQPYHLRLRGGACSVPGTVGRVEGPNGKKVYSCCIVTTGANDLLRRIHDRMPAILPPGRFEAWLAPGRNPPTSRNSWHRTRLARWKPCRSGRS
jgi:putative SOS response-associated peptidase YedK